MTFNEGDIVRIKATGFTGELDEINPNENFDPVEEYWAVVRDDNFNSKELDSPDEIELVMSTEDAAKRTVPTPKELLSAIDFLSTWASDSIEISESETDGEDAVMVYGRTAEGIRFGARIVVESIERTDW